VQSSFSKWYTGTMDDFKAVLKTTEGKFLVGCLAFILVGMAAEQYWWTHSAPRGTLRCTESFTGIVCMRKK